MLKKINDLLAGIPMTIVGGVSLVLSLAVSAMDIALPIDPAWVSVFVCGIPLLYLAIWRIIYLPGIRKISSAFLISVAMFAAIAIGDLFAAGEVAFIMALGAILEEKTTERAKKGLNQLIRLTPQKGRRIVNGKEEQIPVEQICTGDIVRILPGETVPVDGEIVSGSSSIDQSVMTGESLPMDRGVGDSVFCGTVNCYGAIDIRASDVGQNTSLHKLIHMVEQAEEKQAPMQRIADRCASWLVPAALLIAVAAYIFTRNLTRAVTVLVVFCPCALVLATPTAVIAAIGQATKHGVVIKSGEALEKMGKVETIALDKTGTLTFGRPEVSDTVLFSSTLDAGMLLGLVAAAETRSEHPLGKAIARCAQERGFNLPEAEAFHMEAGKGIKAIVAGKQLCCGSEAYLMENGVEISEQVFNTLEQLRNQGKVLVLAAVEGRCAGAIALSDVLRPNAGEVIASLEEMGTRTVLLTGDNCRTAEYFAKRVGMKSVCAGLLPGQKVEQLIRMKQSGQIVCMVGDGVNDAPALKTADVGVAMGGTGSDIAVDAADIALMSDDIDKIPYLKRLSSATVRTIRCSIGLSLCINAMAITLSLMGILTPTTGALVHNAGSCFVVLIAALLYDRKFD